MSVSLWQRLRESKQVGKTKQRRDSGRTSGEAVEREAMAGECGPPGFSARSSRTRGGVGPGSGGGLPEMRAEVRASRSCDGAGVAEPECNAVSRADQAPGAALQLSGAWGPYRAHAVGGTSFAF